MLGVARLVLMLLLPLGLPTAGAQSGAVSLVLEKNPPEGGRLSPADGVLHFSTNSEVALTAVPKPGYRFAYWLGDVVRPDQSTTRVRLTDSKAVVAVFERVAPELVGDDQTEEPELPRGGGGGPAALLPTATDFFTTSWGISGGAAPAAADATQPILIQTPEPATFLLFGVGGVLAARARRPRRARQARA